MLVPWNEASGEVGNLSQLFLSFVKDISLIKGEIFFRHLAEIITVKH